MKGVYLTYISTSDGERKLVPRLEEHVVLPELTSTDVLVHVKACALSRLDITTLKELNGDLDQFPVGHEISGIVTKIGDSVSLVSVTDQVCGILPLDTECPGCAEYCIVPEFCIVKKPFSLSHVDTVALLRPSLRAYTCLYYQIHTDSNNTVLLLFSAYSANGLAIIGLCETLQVKVIAVVNSADEADKLATLYPSLYKIVNVVSVKDLIEVCRQETEGLGVNCIIDDGVHPGYSIDDINITSSPSVKDDLKRSLVRHEYETTPTTLSSTHIVPTQKQIIDLLAPQGHWITTLPDLQLDPPRSRLLYLKGCSLHFLFDPVWNMSCTQQGKYLCILTDAMIKLKEGKLKPLVQYVVSINQVCDELVKLGKQQGRVVMTTDVSQLG